MLTAIPMLKIVGSPCRRAEHAFDLYFEMFNRLIRAEYDIVLFHRRNSTSAIVQCFGTRCTLRAIEVIQ